MNPQSCLDCGASPNGLTKTLPFLSSWVHRHDSVPLSTVWSPASKKMDSLGSQSLVPTWLLEVAPPRVSNHGENKYLLSWYPHCHIALNIVIGFGGHLPGVRVNVESDSYANPCNCVSQSLPPIRPFKYVCTRGDTSSLFELKETNDYIRYFYLCYLF